MQLVADEVRHRGNQVRHSGNPERGSGLEFTVLLNSQLDPGGIDAVSEQNVQLDRPSPPRETREALGGRSSPSGALRTKPRSARLLQPGPRCDGRVERARGVHGAARAFDGDADLRVEQEFGVGRELVPLFE